MNKFKAGDRVYCPCLGLEVYTVYLDDDGDLVVSDEWDICYVSERANEADGASFHATTENKKALEQLYEMGFEAV